MYLSSNPTVLHRRPGKSENKHTMQSINAKQYRKL